MILEALVVSICNQRFFVLESGEKLNLFLFESLRFLNKFSLEWVCITK